VNDPERAAWLGWCVVAGAKFPFSAELVAKIFKPLLLSPPSPEREQALKALSRKLGDNGNSPPPSGILARTLGSCGVLALVAKCLEEVPGQEPAARCVYFAACADVHAARTLVANSAQTRLLPLLTSPDDSLQNWSAAALTPIIASDPHNATRCIIDDGGIFTVVALLSSSSSAVRSHALATLVALCSAGIEAAWPNHSLGVGDAGILLHTLVEGAIDAGICRSLIPLIREKEANIAGTALETIAALNHTSLIFQSSLRHELGNDRKYIADFVAACDDPSLISCAVHVLADMCYYIDDETGDEDNASEAAACKVTKQLYAIGGLRVATMALNMAINTNTNARFSTLLAVAAQKKAGHCRAFDDSHHDAGAQIIAAIISCIPNAIGAFKDLGQVLSALASTVAFELAPSLEASGHQPRAVSALSALISCICACAARHDAGAVIEVAQVGLLELITTHKFLDVRLVCDSDDTSIHGLIAARVATLVHICIHACWCGGNDGALFILALVGPPNGRLLSRLCDLLDGLAKNELLVSDSPRIATGNTLTIAILLALGSLCGAARPFGEMPHPSENMCKRDISQNPRSCLALAMSLSHESLAPQQAELRRAAARLLSALLRGNLNPIHCRGAIATLEPTDVIGLALARAGLVEITARGLGDSDAIVRADVLDAFASLSAHAPSLGRNITLSVAALGNNLARGYVASDATHKHAAAGNVQSEFVQIRSAVAVERALGILNSTCREGCLAACDEIACSQDCQGALVSLSRISLCVTSDFALRCSALSLSSIAALAAESEDRAVALAGAGACEAAASVLVTAIQNKDRVMGIIEHEALGALSALATYPKPRRRLAATKAPVFNALFLEVLKFQDTRGFKLARIALSVLLHFTHPTDIIRTPQTTIKLAAAAKYTGAIGSLAHALNGGWTLDCNDVAEKRFVTCSAHQILAAVANAPNICSTRHQVNINDRTSRDHNASSLSSIELIHSDCRSHFEERYRSRSQQLHLTASNKTFASIGDVNVATLVSLIATTMKSDDPAAISAHLAAVDRAWATLRGLIKEDILGCVAAEVIHGGLLVNLFLLAPKSAAAANCLVALCKAGELHRPLLLSAPTAQTIDFIDTLVRMLCATPQSTSQAGTDLDLARAALKILRIICFDSSDAILALAVAFAARGAISSAVTRITAIVGLEVSAVMADKKPRFPNTLILLCILIPHLLDTVSSVHGLRSASLKPTVVNLGSKSIVLLVERLAIDGFKLASCMQTMSHYSAMGFVSLLDTAALSAVAKLTPLLLRVLHILPEGDVRGRARCLIAAIFTMSPSTTCHIQGASTVEAAVKLVVNSTGEMSTNADVALGFQILFSLLNTNGAHAAQAILTHKNLLAILQAQVTFATVLPEIGPFAFEALALIAELSRISQDTCGYVASTRAFIRSLTLLAIRTTPFGNAVTHGNSVSSTPLQTCWLHILDVAESAQLVLANASGGALAQRDAIVRVHGILNSAIAALKASESARIQAAAARLLVAILRVRSMTNLTASTAKVIMLALRDAFGKVTRRDHTDVAICLLYLLDVLHALSCHPEGVNALRSPGPVALLCALLQMTAGECYHVYVYISEVCASQITSMCFDPYHLKIIRYHYVTTLIKVLKCEHTCSFLQLQCINILHYIARIEPRLVLVDTDIANSILWLSTSRGAVEQSTRYLAAALTLDCGGDGEL